MKGELRVVVSHGVFSYVHKNRPDEGIPDTRHWFTPGTLLVVVKNLGTSDGYGVFVLSAQGLGWMSDQFLKTIYTVQVT